MLIPQLSELEWAIKPRLEEWAEVASYDPPGVGGEPQTATNDLPAFVENGLRHFDELGWSDCFFVADGWGSPLAVHMAVQRREAVRGLAIGHAAVSYSHDGDRPAVNGSVVDVMRGLVRSGKRGLFVNALSQFTAGSYGPQLAEAISDRIPPEGVPGLAWFLDEERPPPITDLLRELDVPLLFVKHEGCLQWTPEGFEDATVAFPDAQVITVTDAPPVSEEFAAAIQRFCLEAD